MKELLDDSLAYAAYTGFQPAVETLVQRGGGKKYSEYHSLTAIAIYKSLPRAIAVLQMVM